MLNGWQHYDYVRRQGTIITVKPDGNPVSVAEAKRQLRIDHDDTDQDNYIAELCGAAHRAVESQLGYPILRQTRQTHLFGFPCGAIWLGGGDSLTVSQVRYFDSSGTQQVLPATDYIVDAISRPAALLAAPFKPWPSVIERPGAVMIDWLAGWNSAADVPEDLIHAMKLLIGHYDQNREAVIVGATPNAVQHTVDALLEPWRIVMFA